MDRAKKVFEPFEDNSILSEYNNSMMISYDAFIRYQLSHLWKDQE